MRSTKGRLEGKVAIVTGAGRVGPGWGNGRAIAVRFAEEGAVNPLSSSAQHAVKFDCL